MIDIDRAPELDDEPEKTAPAAEQITVVAVPMGLFGDILEVLQEMPYKTVGKLLTRLGQLKPQNVHVAR